MSLIQGQTIIFDRKKTFEYLNSLGRGGTGDTHLFLDKTTDIKFAIKKYLPCQTEFKKELYERFVNEIKILFKISHPNIVRIYNYYLYPEFYVGYLQMEYIQGVSIEEYDQIFPWDKTWDDIFIETIRTFKYLESQKILHRDIRTSNIMITSDQNVKVIDFGFGKMLNISTDEDENKNENNSVLLNWPVTEFPKEISEEKNYTQQSEIYFLGKIFDSILKKKKEYKNFRYKDILEKMIMIDPIERYNSFEDIEQDISSDLFNDIEFNESDKQIYNEFANNIEKHIRHYNGEYVFIYESSLILNNLKKLIKKNSLETFIQNNSELINIFIKGVYTYTVEKNITIKLVKDFYSFLYKINSNQRAIVLENLYSRLATIKTIVDDDDDFPF